MNTLLLTYSLKYDLLNNGKGYDINNIFNNNYEQAFRFFMGRNINIGLKNDLLDLAISKDMDNYSLVFDVMNLLNERYEKPATYKQDGRQFMIKYVKFY